MGESLLTGQEGTLSPAFERIEGVLSCRGLSLEELAAGFGTPLYVYDIEGVLERVERFRRAFRDVPFLLAYSVKANGSLAILNRIGATGAGADIVSLGELHRALKAGIPAERIVFAGVGKTEPEMVAALEAGIRAFHVESTGELDLLARVADRSGTPVPVSLRVNPDVDSRAAHAYTRTGHAASKFGISTAEAEALYREHRDDSRIRFVGIDVHIGSQIVEAEPYMRALATVLEIVDGLAMDGIELEYLDLGGGFGIGYDGGAGLDLEALARDIVPEVRARQLQLLLEPGRSIIGEPGVLLTRVLYTKVSGGKHFIVCDGAMNDLLRPSHYGGFHRIVDVGPRTAGRIVEADVVGPICESGDFLARDREMCLPEPGDLLAVGEAGAYGSAMASNYNSRLRAAEVMIERGRAVLIHDRETFDDLLRGEEIPPLEPT